MKRQRNIFWAGVGVLALTAVAHTLGMTTPTTDPAGLALEQSMRDYAQSAGFGLHTNAYAILMALGYTMLVYLFFQIVLNAIIARMGDARLVRAAAWVNATACLGLAGLYAMARFPPPLICYALAGLLFLAAALMTRET